MTTWELPRIIPMDDKYDRWAGNHLCFCHRMGCLLCYMIVEIQMLQWKTKTK